MQDAAMKRVGFRVLSRLNDCSVWREGWWGLESEGLRQAGLELKVQTYNSSLVP